MIKPWQIQKSEPIVDCRIFKVRKDVTVNPRTGRPHDMYVLEHPDWVNIIPLTPDDQVVMVRQWRHGTRTLELETPGGLMEEGETWETCARRELIEETGYAAEEFIHLGAMHPNPAIQDNWQHFALARHCRPHRPPELDHAEDIAVTLEPLAAIPTLIRSGQITHGVVIAAFYWLELYRQSQPR